MIVTRHTPTVARRRRPVARGLAVAALMTLPCCNPAEIHLDYVAREGTIENVNVSRKIVTFRFRHDKTGEYRRETGYVLPDTEILIDGRLSTLADIRPGERVVAVWLVRKTLGQPVFSALKIHITRDVDTPPS